MTLRAHTYRGVDELLRDLSARRMEIGKRLAEFAAVPPSDYLFEMVYCLLTPQSSARNAARAVQRLQGEFPWRDAVTVSRILSDRNAYIRFHNTKALNVIRAQERFPEVLQHLTDGLTSRELRRWLVLNVRGLGWKEASHFLRNIGHRELAILDRHILRNLHRHRVIRSLHATLTPSRYLAIEQRFGRFAKAIGSSLDELDLFFWSRETGEILK